MERNYFEELMNQTLTKDQIEVRIADVDMNGFTLVVYKTRNADKNILDNIVGPSNWQKGHNGNPHNCYVEIWDPVKQMWIHKDNFGESLDRSTKGSATDAMKRAGEDWGIGRELYTCPRIFIKSPTVEVSYGTGYELPDDVRATYDNENMFVKEPPVLDRFSKQTTLFLHHVRQPLKRLRCAVFSFYNIPQFDSMEESQFFLNLLQLIFRNLPQIFRITYTLCALQAVWKFTDRKPAQTTV